MTSLPSALIELEMDDSDLLIIPDEPKTVTFANFDEMQEMLVLAKNAINELFDEQNRPLINFTFDIRK